MDIKGLRPSKGGSRKLYIETYGCQMNTGDSEIVVSIMQKEGYSFTGDIAEADVIFVNTCSVRDNAEQRIWGRLNEFKRYKKRRPDLVVGVLGCMAERLKESLMERERIVDVVAGPDSYRSLPDLVRSAADGIRGVNVQLSKEETYAEISPVRLDKNGVGAFIAIMRGCNNMCSYCVVPYTRGRERSRDPQTIVREVRELFAAGYREVTLLGQNVNSYRWPNSADAKAVGTAGPDAVSGKDVAGGPDGTSAASGYDGTAGTFEPDVTSAVSGYEVTAGYSRLDGTFGTDRFDGTTGDAVAGPAVSGQESLGAVRDAAAHYSGASGDGIGTEPVDFAALLDMVASVSPLLRVRFATSHPKDLSDTVLETMARKPNICRSIHLPAQSGSSRMLAVMNRRYTREWYLGRIAAIRWYLPDCTVTTDLIAGFCTETEEDHLATLSLMREVGYSFAFMFKYSERPGTKASRSMPDDVPEGVKTRRLTEIINLQNELSLEGNRQDVGRTFEVLTEGVSKRSPDQLFGRTSQNKVVVFDRGNTGIGEYVEVEITGCSAATLYGKLK
ncbi:MAG: radical SAM protein [Rikenellaceae bacterium]|nr:radical SAM protein [Rikenellaceae bacterium]